MSQNASPFDMSVLSGWTHGLGEIRAEGLEMSRTATADECSGVADILGLEGCDELEIRYKLVPGETGVVLKGRLRAEVTQLCVISLEPVPSRLEEDLNVVFSAAARAHEHDGKEDQRVLKGRSDQLIDHETVDVGRFCIEVISSALDPYPKAEGAQFDGGEPAKTSDTHRPFAVLGQLQGSRKKK